MYPDKLVLLVWLGALHCCDRRNNKYFRNVVLVADAPSMIVTAAPSLWERECGNAEAGTDNYIMSVQQILFKLNVLCVQGRSFKDAVFGVCSEYKNLYAHIYAHIHIYIYIYIYIYIGGLRLTLSRKMYRRGCKFHIRFCSGPQTPIQFTGQM